MGRQGSDHPTVVTTSIALLQERFRQLQRVREKREEKELLKQICESNRMAPTTMGFESNQCYQFQPEMFLSQSRPAPQDSLSLGLNLQSKHTDYQAATTTTTTTTPTNFTSNYWPHSTPAAGTSRSFENSDVDTSLHL